jgi:tetratricopeptide (TPR) repeat protein
VPEALDDSERQAAAEFFESKLRAIVGAERQRGVLVVLWTVAPILRDWRHSTEYAPQIPQAELARWQGLMQQARAALDRSGPDVPAVESARRALAQARELAPRDAETCYLLGRAHEYLGRFEEADAAYRRACELDEQGDRASDAINRAIRAVARTTDVVLVDVERLFHERSPNGLIGFDWIEDYVHPTVRGHQEIAFAIWQALIEHGVVEAPRDRTPREVFDAICAERAQRVLVEENTSQFLFNQAVLFAEQRQYERALATLRQCVARDPAYPVAHLNIANLLTQQFGDPAGALPAYREALRYDPRSAAAYRDMGFALVELGRRGEALAALRKALEIAPDLGPTHNAVGALLAEDGQLEQALVHLEKAVALDPEDVTFRYNLGKALVLLQRPAQARPHFERILALQPDNQQAREALDHIGAR